MYWSRRLLGLTALLSASAAAPAPEMPPGKIEQVPPEQALAILGLPVSEQDGKPVGRLVDVLIDAVAEFAYVFFALSRTPAPLGFATNTGNVAERGASELYLSHRL